MSLVYHVAVGREKLGPLTQLEVRRRIDESDFDADNLAWHQGLDGWKALSEFPEFTDVLNRQSGVPGDPGDTEFAEPWEEDLPDARPEDLARAQETIENLRSPEEFEPQPFRIWTRVAARAVDFIVINLIIAMILLMIAPGLVVQLGFLAGLINVAFASLLEAGFLCSFGTTPGKALLGVTVRSSTGEILTWGAAVRRSLLVWLRGLGLGHPLFAALLGALCFLEVQRRGDILWDREQELQVTYRDPSPLALGTALAIILGFALMFFSALGQLEEMIRTGNLPEGFELPPGFELPTPPAGTDPSPAPAGEAYPTA